MFWKNEGHNMDQLNHPFHALFEQLGLPCDAVGIAQFIQTHSPLPGNIALPDAAFWTPAQAHFLRETLQEDNDWSHQVDQLSKVLRGR
jgi:Protein of unknown function (DUF2789)